MTLFAIGIEHALDVPVQCTHAESVELKKHYLMAVRL
jgi:hypothetical protein